MEKLRLSLRGLVAIVAVVLCAAFWLAVASACSKALATPTTDREAMRVIDRVNRAVNVERRWGEPEPRDQADGVWDCENFAGLKRDRLAAEGFSHAALRTYFVTTSWGEAHAVLEVALPSGKRVILDNLTPWALTRDQTRHTNWQRAYIQRQEP